MRKTELLAFLQNQTDFFDPDNLSEVFTASWLARRFAMQRNTASHYLNQLVAQDVLVKINTRPVYFLHKKAFCQQFYPLSRSEYASMAELLAESDRQPEQADHFSLLTGHDGSLRKPIEQMKTALFYPNGGLPLLITGDSGTGKSYMAELMHEFAIAQGLLAPDAPFVSFNCAQYASNPELLAANLFGYVKGAFTGAQSDKAGAFEAANGGMLFLDESIAWMLRGRRSCSPGWIVRRSTGWGRPRKACRFRCGWCLPPPKIFTALFSLPSCAEFRSWLACPIFNTVAARRRRR